MSCGKKEGKKGPKRIMALTRSVYVMGRTIAAVLGTAVKFGQCADTDVLAEVDVSSNRS
jgi:hypothetical protein